MTKFEDILSTLEPKTAARVKTAADTEVVKLPLASYGLTKQLGGGIAKKQFTLLWGNQSSGKTLLMLQSVAIWQNMGLLCVWVDVEGVFDKEWAAGLGVDLSQLVLIQAKSSGRIESELRPWLEGGADAVVIDSISQILPESFIGKDGSMNEQDGRKQIGAHAKACTALINGIDYMNEQAAIVMISQSTIDINAYGMPKPHGGQKPLFVASQIIKLTSSGSEKNQHMGMIAVGDSLFERPVGREVFGYIEKNKLGPQSGKCSYDVFYAGSFVGIDHAGEVVDECINYHIIHKGGAWYSWNDQKWQGRPATVKFFRDDPESLQLLKKEIHTFETGEI